VSVVTRDVGRPLPGLVQRRGDEISLPATFTFS